MSFRLQSSGVWRSVVCSVCFNISFRNCAGFTLWYRICYGKPWVLRLQFSGVWRSVICSLGCNISEEPPCSDSTLEQRLLPKVTGSRLLRNAGTCPPKYVVSIPEDPTINIQSHFNFISNFEFINLFMLRYCVNFWSYVASLAWDAYC